MAAEALALPGLREGLENLGLTAAAEIQAIKYRASMSEVYGLLHMLQIKTYQDRIREDAARIEGKLLRFPGGFGVFSELWESARQLIGLQARLFMEQKFWNLGDPWRALVTGFKPIGAERAEQGVVAGEEGSREGPVKEETKRPSYQPPSYYYPKEF